MFIDNNLLIYVIIIVKLDVMLYRWLVFLFNYNFKFNYKIGKFNRDGLFCRFVEILLNVIKVLKLVVLVEKEEFFLVESIVLLENVIFEKVSEDKEM